MKFQINRDEFLRKMDLIIDLANHKTSPILSSIVIESSKQGVHLKTTDIESFITAEIEKSDVYDEGVVLIDAHLLHTILTHLPNESNIRVELKDDNIVSLSCAHLSYQLKSEYKLDEWPAAPSINRDDNFTIKANILCHLIEKVRIAASSDESKPTLNGILIEASTTTIKLVATDGHRLITMEENLPSETNHKIIIPTKSVDTLLKILKKSEDTVTITIDNDHAKFSSGSITLISKTTPGTFPDYEKLIPNYKTSMNFVEIDKSELILTLNALSPICELNADVVECSLVHNHLRLSTSSPDMESASATIHIDNNNHPITIGFNYKYLLDAVNILDAERIQLYFETPHKPAIVKSPNSHSPIHLLMPIRIR